MGLQMGTLEVLRLSSIYVIEITRRIISLKTLGISVQINKFLKRKQTLVSLNTQMTQLKAQGELIVTRVTDDI